MDERVHDADVSGNFGRRDEAGKNEMFLQAEAFCQIFESPAPFAVADEKEFDFWILADEFRRNGEQIIVPLELEQPRDFADDEIAGINSQFFPQFQIIFRRKKWLEREAAEDFGVLLRPANAGGEIFVLHRIGDDDEMRRGAGGGLERK